ncbi:MAG: protein-(glutamine-N5) methyltransferase, release factor-specific [Alphaproteobacteria bacterium]|jgi:release factor glutamine methyltransferase|nr:protein-(glutamine-N5) methyltransferase, release factor-specific [Alphaproteobacteria bacterium]PPR14515.1 MAG: Release factor glutamine methyltransferase [Alphaproteobacteria bacterium MarineAlpha12_Bin1]|tara:strand:+ start:20006 stop:20893 length:888 start_codon:yes stop_codon:yes gene_type:complete
MNNKRSLKSALNHEDNIDTVLHKTAKYLSEAGIETSFLEAKILLKEATGLKSVEIMCERDIRLTSNEIKKLINLSRRRYSREPIFYILGNREFWSLNFNVDERVLTPRPDSETLIQTAGETLLDRNSNMSILDLGVGSGCLLISLLKEYKYSFGLGVDVSYSAIQVARENAHKLGVGDRSLFVVSDWASALNRKYDLIISNPPYISSEKISNLAPEISKFEPKVALDGGIDGLDCYRSILPNIRSFLKPQGTAIIELGEGQEAEIREIAYKSGMRIKGFRADIAGILRVAILCHL